MTAETLSDQQLVDSYAQAIAGADPSSPDFSFERAASLAYELESRGFTESGDRWTHPDKEPLVPVE